MLPLSAVAVFALSFVPSTLAAAIEGRTVTTLSTAQVNAYNPYTYFAAAGYCEPSTTLAWSCGTNCDALSGFLPTASGGDGAVIQYWYVGYYPTLNTVVAAFQGTDASKIIPALTDADFILTPLDNSSFPGVPSGVKTHNGFANAQKLSSAAVLTAVNSTLTAHPTASITVVGHSLGAAIAQLSIVQLKLKLPSGTVFKYVGYGTPRVGNPAWAAWVDSLITDLTRVNNKQDFVPILPGRSLGYWHPSGEKHISSTNAWLACSGEDSTETGCTDNTVPTIFQGDTDDHAGPYNGIYAEC